jgi:vancomycin resistance protein VanJ
MNLYRVISGAYGLNVSALLLIRAIVGESWKLVALFNSYLHLLLIPALVFLPLTLLMKRWRLALLQVPPVILFIATYGVQFLPRGEMSVPPDTPRLSLLSYNLSKDNPSADDAIRIIREANADLVALQELNPLLADAFEGDLADIYPYRALHPDKSYPGQGVLSRFPIVEDSYWKIHLGHQRVKIETNGAALILYNTHPVHPFLRERGFFDPTLRAAEINDLLTRAEGETDPVLIAGDFNMTDLTADYQRIAVRYGDTYREVGWGMGFTFPDLGQRLLLARLDYVFHSQQFVALEAHVLTTSGGSDHRPLLVRFALGEGR